MVEYIKNQLRGYNVVLATLQSFSGDICKECIGLEQVEIKVEKGLKKLRMDLETSATPEDEKNELLNQIGHFYKIAAGLLSAEEFT